METDGNRIVLGAVLKQKFDDTEIQYPIGFFSRSRVEQSILRLSEYTFRIEYHGRQFNVIADVQSRLPFATAKEGSANSVSTAKLDFNSQTSATTRCKPERSNLRLVSLKRNDNFKIESDIDESDTDSDANSFSNRDFGETPENWVEFETELCNLNQTSALLVDIPIIRKKRVPEDFSIPTREDFATEQEANTELNQMRN